MELPEAVRAWRDAGEFRHVDGTQVFLRDTGHGEPLVCFHGFPTSSYDWHRLLPLLAHRYRIICFDFPGYGLSAKPVNRDYSIARQADTAEELLHSLGVDRFHLMAHDMGVSVACELLGRIQQRRSRLQPESVTLLNAGLFGDLHQPLLTQRLLRSRLFGAWVARFTSHAMFLRQYPLAYARPKDFSEQHYAEQWALLVHNEGRRVLHKLAGYMRERAEKGEAWLQALRQSTAPIRWIWGLSDPISVPAIADRIEVELQPEQVVRLTGVGHYPQLEEAVSVYTLVTEWFDPEYSESLLMGA